MKAAFLKEPGVITIEEVKKPSPGPGEVLVKIRSVGVCGSDVHYYRHGRIGSYVVQKPLILGHECSGEVVELGPGVKTLEVGDRVALEPGIPCRKCRFCKTGRYNLCPDVVFMATPPVDGAFVEFVAFPEDFAFRLPDNVSFDEGALIEPLAVGIYSMERAGVEPGESVVILGAGPIGLLTLQAARAYGANPVVITDASAFRLSVARSLGADLAVNVSEEKAIAAILEYLGAEADVVVEAAGAPAAIQETWKLVRRGGRVVFIGLPAQDIVGYSFAELSRKELDILGIFRYANVYPRAIHMVARGIINLKALITHHFPLEEVQAALELADRGKEEA
ncbi:MAG: NAD(P)-dependent alcohol dehydrogenase, partial [Moorella sp. (in: Bacteria)]|nr:NAD(P)-dependent alcohol dehydrogenase [Moorella sp. (in: firmicutes)]